MKLTFYFSLSRLVMIFENNQVRIVFLYWLPCILRMRRPGGQTSMEYPPTPTSDASERKAANIQDVELRERFVG